MKKKLAVIIAALIVAAAAVFAFFFWGDDSGKSSDYYQYYVGNDGTQLFPYEFKTDKTSTEDLIAAIAANLKNQKSGSDKTGLLPEEVAITDYRMDGTMLILNMSFEYSQMSATREILTRAGLVKSFTQVDGVDSVLIQIGGNSITDSKGNVIGPLTDDDFVEAEGKEIDAYQNAPFTLYFADASGEKLVKVEYTTHWMTSVPIEKQVVQLLEKGPRDSSLRATIPSDLEIISATLSDGIVYVNLEEKFLNGNLPLSDKLVVYSLVNSLLELDGAEKVQISINGDTNYTMKNDPSIDFNNFLTKDETLIGE